MKIVICGLSITSCWGNGHATTYRALVGALARRGHDVLFLERDVPRHADHRDLPSPPLGRTRLYGSLEELDECYRVELAESDLVIVGSRVPQGVQVGRWALAHAGGAAAFYDMDTHVTLGKIRAHDFEYLHPELIPRYDLYLSFIGGPVLRRLERVFASPMARALYGAADPELYRPVEAPIQWDLGYLGSYSPECQAGLERLLLGPARAWSQGRFVVAGQHYPDRVRWPGNVHRIDHLPGPDHPGFYRAQRLTLNLTRLDMARAGWCPSASLFEAAACGTVILSDWWNGLESFFRLGREILVARTGAEALEIVRHTGDGLRGEIGDRARRRVLSAHTAEHRAVELERHARAALEAVARRRRPVAR